MNSRMATAMLMAVAIGAGYGVSGYMANIPEPRKPRKPNEADRIAQQKAAEKRARKAAKRAGTRQAF